MASAHLVHADLCMHFYKPTVVPGYSGERRREEDATHARGHRKMVRQRARQRPRVQVKEGPAKGTVDVHSRHT
jgi:hypothetical protein